MDLAVVGDDALVVKVCAKVCLGVASRRRGLSNESRVAGACKV
jgi:hypothetical protein